MITRHLTFLPVFYISKVDALYVEHSRVIQQDFEVLSSHEPNS